jgi:TolB protein
MQNPSFSPDSSHLLFTNFTAGYNVGSSAVGVVSVSGGSPTILVPANAQNVNLPGCWNAGLNQIVISSDVSGPLDQIYRIDPAGVAQPQLVATPTMRAWEPSLSPDGQWVVFEAHSPAGGSGDPGRIWKVRNDGTQLTQLTPDSVDAKQPNWSPKGDRILYQATGPGGGVDIFMIDASGGSLANVTNGGSSESTDASWSPDGSSIVYSSDLSGNAHASLYVIPAQGGTPVRVTFGTSYDGAPSWSPDGKCIAFETYDGSPDGSPGTTIAIVPAP